MTNKALIVASMIALISLTGCEKHSDITKRSPQRDVDNDLLKNQASAEQAWKQVVANRYTPRGSGEAQDELIALLEWMELERQAFREKGAVYWKRFPTSTNRYRWLILTTYMSPVYPKNVRDWAVSEAKEIPYTGGFQETTIDEWVTGASSLYESLFQSDDVPEIDKLVLEIVLLRNEIEGELPGSTSERKDGALEKLIELAGRAVGLTTSVSNRSEVFVSRLIAEVLRDNRLDMACEELLVFAIELSNQVEGVPKAAAQFFLRNSNCRDPNTSLGGLSEIQDNDSNRMQRFRDVPGKIGASIATYEGILEDWRQRYRGIMNWQELTREQKHNWLFGVNYNPNYFSVLNLMRAIDAGSTRIAFEPDIERIRRFDRAYSGFREEVFGTHALSDNEAANLLFSELFRYLGQQKEMSFRGEQPYVSSDFYSKVISLVYEFRGYELATEVLSILFYEKSSIGAEMTDIKGLLKRLEGAGPEGFRSSLVGFQRLSDVVGSEFHFQAVDWDGNKYSSDELLGKYVLVDHWATTCASCVEAMPKKNYVYRKYRESGFEVLSIVYDGTSRRHRVQRLLSELDLQWITLNGEGQWNDVANRYSYGGYPQYMLLDKDGRVIADTSDINALGYEGALARFTDLLIDE